MQSGDWPDAWQPIPARLVETWMSQPTAAVVRTGVDATGCVDSGADGAVASNEMNRHPFAIRTAPSLGSMATDTH